MSETFKRLYGLDWPKNVEEPFIHLCCAKKWREPEYRSGKLLDPGDHMVQAIKMLFTPEQWTLSPWDLGYINAWCTESSIAVLGCAASSKSWTFGGLAMLDYLTDPLDTVTLMISTSKVALADRTFASAAQLFQVLKQHPKYLIPGRLSRAAMSIMIGDDDGDNIVATNKTALRGIAMQSGTVEEARNSLSGRHSFYVNQIIDELAAMKPSYAQAALEARTNLQLGASRLFRLVVLANPESTLDACGVFTEPLAGWGSVDKDTKTWRSKSAYVIHRNGYDSPAIKEPDKYPYLIRQDQIEKIIEEDFGNTDSKRVWTMIYGFPPAQGSESTILSTTEVQAYKMSEPVYWLSGENTVVAGFDPAFSSGGDDAILQLGTVGRSVDGILTVGLGETCVLKIEAGSTVPVTYQLMNQLRELQERYGFDWMHLGVDDSGTQSMADIIQQTTGVAPFRVVFNARASDMPVSVTNRQPSNLFYKDRITEYYYTLAEFGRYGQLRGFTGPAVSQVCNRKLLAGRLPRQLEPKGIFKKRAKRSPDHADATAVLIGVVKDRLRVLPGATDYETAPRAMAVGFDMNLVLTYDLDSRDDCYTVPGV